MMKNIKYLSSGIFLAFLFNVAAADTSFSYVPTFNKALDSDTISVLNYDPATGVLSPSTTPEITFNTMLNLSEVTTDPSGKYIYALSFSNGIYTYAVDLLNNGALSPVGSAIATDDYPEQILFHGNYAYIPSQGRLTNSGSVAVYSYNASNGSLTQLQTVPNTVGNPNGLTIDSSGKYAYVTTTGGNGNQLLTFSINPDTGLLSPLGITSLRLAAPSGIAADQDEHIYLLTNNPVTGAGLITPYSINPDTGSLSALPSIATGTFPTGITLAPNDTYAYVPFVTTAGASIDIYSVNQTAGTLTTNGNISVVKTSGGQGELTAPVFDTAGDHMYVTAPDLTTIYMFNFNAANGQLTPLSTPSYNINNPVGKVTFN